MSTKESVACVHKMIEAAARTTTPSASMQLAQAALSAANALSQIERLPGAAGLKPE